MIVFSYICLFVITMVLFVVGIIYFDRSLKKRMTNKIETFDKYIIVLEYHMSRAYDIIYKDKISFFYFKEKEKLIHIHHLPYNGGITPENFEDKIKTYLTFQ